MHKFDKKAQEIVSTYEAGAFGEPRSRPGLIVLIAQFGRDVAREVREEEQGHAVEYLQAARDVLVSIQKELGSVPLQSGYSTRMTNEEMRCATAVSDLDSIIRQIRDAKEEDVTSK